MSERLKCDNVIERRDFVMEARWWNEFLQQCEGTMEVEHRTHPKRRGLALSELRQALARELPLPEVFDVLASELCRNGFVRTGEAIARAKIGRASCRERV